MTDSIAAPPPLAEPRPDPRLGALYDAALSLASREGRWRRALVRQVSPRGGDVIVELNCGAGALAIEIAQASPHALVIAIDEDETMIARARQRAKDANVRIEFARGRPHDAMNILANWAPNKIVSSFVRRAAPPALRSALIEAAHDVLRADGQLHLADYGPQRTPLMRQLFRATRNADHVDKSSSRAPNAMIAAMRAARFVAAEETESFPTPTGSVSLYRARIL